MYKIIKRLFDIFFSFVVILVFLPFGLLISIIIIINSKGPIFFIQKRLGYKGKEFSMIKFRTMVVDAEHMGSKQYSFKNDPRVTSVGRFLRKTSIDEIPQLVNILKGEMSIIGPRPTLIYHPYNIDQYSAQQSKRFEVKPGVTGYAQIKGRKELFWDDRIVLDVYYVEHLSFVLDFKIFVITIYKVLFNKNNDNTKITIKQENNILECEENAN